MDYSINNKLVTKIDKKLANLCKEQQETDDDCNGTMDDKVYNDLALAESKALVVSERESLRAEKVFKVLKKAFGSIEASFRYRGFDNFKKAAKAGEFQKTVKAALDNLQTNKVVLKPYEIDEINEAVEESVKTGSPKILVDKLGAKQNKAQAMVNKAKRKTKTIRSKFGQVKKQLRTSLGKGNLMKHMRSPKSRAKLMNGLGSMVTGISFLANPYDSSGIVDPLIIGKGVMGIIEGIGEILPAPVNAITGLVSSIFNMFTGGGGPSTEEVLKDEFKKQRVSKLYNKSLFHY